MWISFLDSIIIISSFHLVLLRQSQNLIWLNCTWYRRHDHVWCRLNWRHLKVWLIVHLSLLLHHHTFLSLSLHVLLCRCLILSIMRTIFRNRVRDSSSLIVKNLIDLIHIFVSLLILLNE
jgi:hypothetical protein